MRALQRAVPTVRDGTEDRSERRRGLTIRRRFGLLLAVVVIALGILVGVAVQGLADVRAQANRIYADNLGTLAVTTRTSRTVSRVAELEARYATDRDRSRVRGDLAVALPDGSTAIANLVARHQDSGDDAEELMQVRHLQSEWQDLLRLHAAAPSDEAAQAAALLDPVLTSLDDMIAREQTDAADQVRELDRTQDRDRTLLAEIGGLAAMLALGAVLWLTRSLVPRVGAYSRYARVVAAGGTAPAIEPSGEDELDDLAKALDNLVGAQRRRADYDARQAEYGYTLQTSQDEAEAHQLLLRHLARSIDGVSATVLYRNNSDDRLQAMTPVPVESPVAAGLEGARPRSCLALRFARRHDREPGTDGGGSLLDCGVCGRLASPTRCEPLPVGGEVIGSVLVEHTDALGDDDAACISDTVAQSAPVLANLRNLALAEFRANSDSLTGLANKRATEDTLKRMVAQASRSLHPLALVLLDLDHFKHVNDRQGHAVGDEVLAAAGAALANGLRASDFAGRYGGEEFLLLLPDTGLDAALEVAEKMRTALAHIRIPGTGESLTASFGVSLLPSHAGNAPDLLRAADRALYLAKAQGRDRVIGAGALPEVPGADLTGGGLVVDRH